MIVIGYSLPKEDQFARLVFRRAIRSNQLRVERGDKPPLRISVIDPDDTVAVTFMRLAGSERGVTYFQARFEEYLRYLSGPVEEGP